MSFSGKYQLESQEGFVPFMKAIGRCLPDDLIEKGKDMKSVSEIEQNGDSFKVTVTTGSKVMTVVTKEGNKLKAKLSGIESVTELLDANTIVHTMTLGDIVFKRTSKRVS
ncbi:hypothetical protein QTP70_034323 [Hemibagrus guttatus]|uniref:Uncharacterized protein n=1 Tax=Hemibagrus guttatus TaxID=175788 RepID=A0AAE0V535_9TELE|nr:hypothetical protein QTP70_034323 [Hemibagrus guttatus]KAK3565847.1 hypothetical protein QTP86_015834 [Hemibagrus guttatus]